MTIIAYHGTNPENADKIEIEGFKIGTYFAYQENYALKFASGRGVLFKVVLPEHWFFKGELDTDEYDYFVDWQFHIRDPLKPKYILERTNEIFYTDKN